MAYCAKSDLVERFGSRELAQLTDESAAQSADDTEIANICDEASSLIDSYLAARYLTPLASPVPTMVRKWACDIARKFLWKDRAGPDSGVTSNYEDAMAQLKDVAKGIAGLPDATGLEAATSSASISVVSSARVFDDDMLGLMPG